MTSVLPKILQKDFTVEAFKMAVKSIHYSDKYYDDIYEYRYVSSP